MTQCAGPVATIPTLRHLLPKLHSHGTCQRILNPRLWRRRTRELVLSRALLITL
jgi:hypothetical protein